MTNRPDSVAPLASKAWTRAEDYIGALARRRTARRAREAVCRRRTEPDEPRMLLSTLPFLVLLAALALLSAAIIIAAWPRWSEPPEQHVAKSEVGTASKGWFQEAEREFHR